MARIVYDSNLGSRTARAGLNPRNKPYYRGLEPGLHLGYRKPKDGRTGTWLARVYTGNGSYRLHKIGVADDFSDADGKKVLSFKQAQNVARGGGYHQGREQRIIKKALDFEARNVEPCAFLYRHYHANGDLLYVGFSLVPLHRQAAHIKEADWRNMICRILIEPFETREEAVAAETAAIRDEFPKFNTMHNRRRHPFQEIARRLGKSTSEVP